MDQTLKKISEFLSLSNQNWELNDFVQWEYE